MPAQLKLKHLSSKPRQMAIKNLRPQRKPIADGAELVLVLPFPVSVNAMFFNLYGRGRAPTKEYQSWKHHAGLEIMRQRAGSVPGRISIDFIVEEKSGRHDGDNLLKCMFDILVEHGVIDGDDSKVVRAFSFQWGAVTGARVTIRRARK